MEWADAAILSNTLWRRAVRVSPGLLPRGDQWERVSAVLADERVTGLDLVDRLIAMLADEVPETEARASSQLADVRMSLNALRRAAARDPALVLWLIGSHRGLGRSFFEFVDPARERPLPCLDVTEWRLPENESGPQTLMFDHCVADWPSLFEDLKRRCGIWGLAHLEAILRLADHRASEEESAS